MPKPTSSSCSTKAKVAFNQDYCDAIRAEAEKCSHTGRDNYKLTLSRARTSILRHSTELHTKKDFLGVKGVGDVVASLLVKVYKKNQ